MAWAGMDFWLTGDTIVELIEIQAEPISIIQTVKNDSIADVLRSEHYR